MSISPRAIFHVYLGIHRRNQGALSKIHENDALPDKPFLASMLNPATMIPAFKEQLFCSAMNSGAGFISVLSVFRGFWSLS
jgi:hypothetical protein